MNHPPTTLPISSLWVIPVHQPQASCILYPVSKLDQRFVSYMIVYMFQCNSPKSSHPLPLIYFNFQFAFNTSPSQLLSSLFHIDSIFQILYHISLLNYSLLHLLSKSFLWTRVSSSQSTSFRHSLARNFCNKLTFFFLKNKTLFI